MGKYGLFLGLMVLLVAAACAPAAAPPAPAPSAPPPAAPAAPKVSPEEEAWNKVVEAAKKEGKLTLYSFSLITETGERVRRAFRERTGITMEIITGSGATLTERIKAERRAGFLVPSTLDTSLVVLNLAKLEGLTQPVGNLPELRAQGVWKYDPIGDKDGHFLSMGPLNMSPWLNTKLVKPGEEPLSWRDLLQPRWKGKMGVGHPDGIPNFNYIFYALTKTGRLDEQYFSELAKQDLRVLPTNRMDGEALARGDTAVSLANTPSGMGPFVREGAPVKAVDFVEGVVISRGISITPLASAPHPNAARVYINWLFSQEGQRVFHESYGTQSVRKDVPNFEPPNAQIIPQNPYVLSIEDLEKIARLQAERVVSKILSAK